MIIKYSAWSRAAKKMQEPRSTLKRMNIYNKKTYTVKDATEDMVLLAAKKSHAERGIYFATVFDFAHKPINFIEFNDDIVIVGFIDDLKREYLSYTFVEISGRLFLSRAHHSTFSLDSDDASGAHIYVFNPEGSVTIEWHESGIRKEDLRQIDVSVNWEDYPDFSHYEKLIQKDRIKILPK